jgi:hypothetical protein
MAGDALALALEDFLAALLRIGKLMRVFRGNVGF